MQPVPIGVVGELYIGGDGLARGYINRPEQTAERFIPNPFAATGERASTHLYKTGDQARYLPDGTIEFIGRKDDQVKLRGFRIELGEIEAILSQHSAIHQCAVILREDQPGDKRLVAYVVSSQTAAPTSQELHQFLQQTLPDFMIPAAFVMLNELPLTPNGKLDRRALPKPDLSQISSSTSFVAPRNDVEQELARIWAEVLKVERVGVQDNFFELGGHSLIATQMLSRIANHFQVNLSIRQLFEAPTIAQLAIAIEHQVQEIEAEFMQLLSEVEDLSDQDAQHQLAQLTDNVPPSN
jgi:acyl carrier protein